MKAVILGAGGQVGRALAAAAPERIDLVSVTRAQCDVADPAQVVAAVEGAALVFNAAAYTAVDRAEQEPEEAHRLNAVAPGQIAEQVRRAGGRTIHISTDFVFDGTAATPRRPMDPTNPQGTYARTKLGGEVAVAAADRSALIVRTAWVYAPEGANFVNTMLRLMNERDQLRVVSDQVGTPTYAPSLAHALWSLALSGAQGIHHYTDAGVASWYDFAIAIAEEAAATGLIPRQPEIVPIATADYPTPAERPAFSVLDKSETWALLGWRPPHWRVNLRTNLRELGNG